jgi:hypothetical protein
VSVAELPRVTRYGRASFALEAARPKRAGYSIVK